MSRHRRTLRSAPLLLALLWVARPPGLEAHTVPVAYDEKSGVDISLNRAYKSPPPFGYMPFSLEIKNKSGATRSWTLRFHDTQDLSRRHEIGQTSAFEFEVENDTTRKFEFLVPLTPRSTYVSPSSYLQWEMVGYGVFSTGPQHLFNASAGKDRTPYFLLGRDWGSDILGRLETRSLGASTPRSLYGSTITPKLLPQDWRGYFGCALVMLTEAEWQALAPPQQIALKNWVAQGGSFAVLTRSGTTNLAVLLDEPAEHLTFSRRGVPALPLGFGTARLVIATGQGYPEKELLDLILNPGTVHSSTLKARNSYANSWGLAEMIPGIAANQGLMLIFVVLFAALIGPVNLFFFAGKKHRYRLFWTTPLISVGASLLLCLAILIFDGLGGHGRRMVAAVVLPHQNQMALFQEQISRTAVLTGAGFQTSRQAALLQIIFSNSGHTMTPINRIRADGEINAIYNAEVAQRHNLSFFQDAGWFSGDYFQSRAVQAQALSAVLPTRARLNLLSPAGGSDAPRVVSDFESKLARVFYRDRDSKLWRGQNLVPGGEVTLEASSQKDFDVFWDAQIALAGGDLAPRLRAVRQRRGHFYAEAEPGTGSPAIDTLGSVAWQDGPVLYLGRPHRPTTRLREVPRE